MSQYKTLLLLTLTVCVSTTSVAQTPNGEQAENLAREAISDYFEAFNSEDHEKLGSLTHYPHVFMANEGGVRINKEPYEIDFNLLREREDWKFSKLDSAMSVLTLPHKVHMLVRFTRFNSKGEGYSQVDGLWIVSEKNGNWGVSVRSY